jgi:release factor glutamine methyltransferase
MAEAADAARTPPRTAGEALALAREYLARKGIEGARLEAELLLAHALGLDRLRLYMQLDQPVGEADLERARSLFARRAAGEPVAYITGRREFYGRGFAVDARVLIPRPETELLADRARELAAERAGRSPRVGDVGTGSGCLAITLALEIDDVAVVACDVSAEALELARENARRLGAAVDFREGDGPGALHRPGEPPFDLIVSNPPYVAPEEAADLPREVRDFEPALALFTPPGDPLHWVRRLLDEAIGLLAPGGTLLVELGAGRGEAAVQLAAERNLDARTLRDLAGIHRILEVRARPSAS